MIDRDLKRGLNCRWGLRFTVPAAPGRRAISGIRAGAGRSRNLAERTAVNTVIQGSSADLIKLAMLAIHRRLRREKLAARMVLQIHDELVFEVPSDQLAYLAELVAQEMSAAYSLRVPLKVDLKAGPNWADAAAMSNAEIQMPKECRNTNDE